MRRLLFFPFILLFAFIALEWKRVEKPILTLVDPEEAPAEIRDEVMHGYRLFMNTREEAKGFDGDGLCCRNCHFVGGNTLGGKNGSISLVGATSWYPAYSERMGHSIDLAERITNCFERSLNGKAPAADSKEMKALIAYLNWISTPAEGRKEFPWRGLPELKTSHTPDSKKGAELYQMKCALCHGANGQGQEMQTSEEPMDIPPLFGPQSFNDGAGMNKIETLSSFIYQNMPYQEPTLTEEEALDIAAFIHSQERPEYAPHHP